MFIPEIADMSVSTLGSRLTRLARDVRGNTAILLSLAIVPIMLAAGASVDMIRADNVRTILQAAADSAALAGGSSGKTEEKVLKKIVDDYLMGNGVGDAVSSVKKIKQKYDKSKGTFEVSIEGTMKTSFMFLAGISEMDISAKSEVNIGGTGLEVVLALDNTESMNYEGRMPALKTAAKSLIDTVLDGASGGGAYVKVGIVPFSNYVNVGVGYRKKSWISVESDSTGTSCWNEYPSATKSNCRMETYTGYNDGVPYTASSEVCDWDWGSPVEKCGTTNFTWNGCVGSRSHPDDSKIVGLGNRYKGLVKDQSGNWGVWCASEITNLSSDKSLLNSKIDAMSGVGNTYVAPGVLWGWNMLDSAEPITGAKTKAWMKSNKGTKALVVMTDGANTLSPSTSNYNYHDGNDVTEANKITAETCKNAKKDDIVIYTVAFMVTDAASKSMLKECATDASKAFDASDPSALNTAFKDIANSLLAIRLTK
jgi:Flp pilus assembly protein TadG